jgi:hypothetical protein
MMKKSFVAALSLISANALATSSVTTFAPGTPISASAVNGNFSSLKAVLDNVEASNAGLYNFPTTFGSTGQVLTTNSGGNLVWQNPGGGGGVSSLNTLTGPLTFAVSTAGSAPNWTTAGSQLVFNIPMAANAGTTAGLVSKASYDLWNSKITNPGVMNGQSIMWNGSMWTGATLLSATGNTTTSLISVGTMSNHDVRIIANNQEMMRATTNGLVGIGTPFPESQFHVKGMQNWNDNTGLIKAEGDLNATSGHQYGMLIQPRPSQGGQPVSFTGIELNVLINGTGTGEQKLVDFKYNNTSKFSINNDGYITGSGFMGSLYGNSFNGSNNITCSNVSLVSGDYKTVSNLNLDFGTNTGGSFTTASGGVFEILLDLPTQTAPSPDRHFSYLLTNGTITHHLNEGRNIKRLPAGGPAWTLKVACESLSIESVVFDAAIAVYGIRKLN